MKSKWHILHPATMFFLMTMFVAFLSWIFDIYGLSVTLPQTGEEIRVQNLLSPEGIRWALRHVVTNFTGFAPLGMVIVAMLGLGVAQHSGFIDACLRRRAYSERRRGRIILWVIILGLLSNVIGDAGYIILLPIAAALFHSVGLNPVGGIITAYASVACGYSANIVISTVDPMLARITEEAAMAHGVPHGDTGALCNYYFMFISTFVIALVCYYVCRYKLLPSMGDYNGKVAVEAYKPLSLRERRAWRISVIVGILYTLVVLWFTFTPYGILRGVSGNLMRSPFIMGVLFLISLGAALMGVIYGFSSGRYRSDSDVVEGLSQPMRLLGVYFVIAFFASQMFACFEYSHLDKCLAILGADMMSSIELNSITMLLLFIAFSAFINLIMVSATAKWSFMAFTFIPVFGAVGVAPDIVQCAYRIGDSATNAITPFLFYMPLVLTYMQDYDKESNYLSLLKYTWRFSVYILGAWTLLFVVWYLCGLPFGL